MLDAKLVREQLEKQKNTAWIDQRFAALGQLPEPLRDTGRTLLGVDAAGKKVSRYGRIDDEVQKQIEAFSQMTEADRRTLVAAVFPELQAEVWKAWEMMAGLPFQSGGARKAFRAPQSPKITDRNRFTWLAQMIQTLGEYPQDSVWVATWAAHLGYYADPVGLLLAAALELGGEKGQKVFDILIASAKGEHEIGRMGRHVTRALLVASNPEGWEFIEKLLLAAQREEGLRQTIFETIDEAHPQAFRRMLRLMLDHNLFRFSSAVRAINVWFGFLWNAVSQKIVEENVGKMLSYLDDPSARDAAIATAPANDAFLALWTVAFENAPQAVPPAAALLDDSNVERRFVGAHFLSIVGVKGARQELLKALDDADLRIAGYAMASVAPRYRERGGDTDLFERLEKLVARAPSVEKTYDHLVWPWAQVKLSKAMVAGTMINALGKRPASRLIEYLPIMDSSGRSTTAQHIVKLGNWDAATRKTLFALLSDPSSSVRSAVFKGIEKCAVTEDEVLGLEALFTRKAGDLRRGLLLVLLNQTDERSLASAQRLMSSSDELQRLGGLELLRQLAERARSVETCGKIARQYEAEHGKLTADERTQLDALLAEKGQSLTLDNALGLMDPAQRTKPASPELKNVILASPAAVAALIALDALIHQHREVPVKLRGWRGEERPEELLGNVRWNFPMPKPDRPVAEQLEALPLKDAWLGWWKTRPADQRDADGLEALRMTALIGGGTHTRHGAVEKTPVSAFASAPKLNYPALVRGILNWLVAWDAATATDFLIDGLDYLCASIPPEKLAEKITRYGCEYIPWRENQSDTMTWLAVIRFTRQFAPHAWTAQHVERYFKLLRWIDEPGPSIPRKRPELTDLVQFLVAGCATEADIYDRLLGPREEKHGNFRGLSDLTTRKRPKLFDACPALETIAARCRQRILEVELARGETPTIATPAAAALKWSGGLPELMRMLHVMQRDTFVRSPGWRADGKAAIFSHLVRVSAPGEADTIDRFKQEMQQAGISEDRLVQLAFFAPHWARHIENALGWPGLEEGVWWVHAHTKDKGWRIEQELREAWNAEVRQRTALPAEDLVDGAVDVAWFNRVHVQLGKQRWASVDAAAKFASTGGGHTRARLFADAMLGLAKKTDLVKRIKEKRNQDALRAIGLLPLASGDKRTRDVLDRYKIVQEFIRTAKQFGSMRQASEKRAAAIAMENLARTAGYADPMRLQWAMETESIADLAQGPVTAQSGEVTVSLSIDHQGEADVLVTKKGKPLAAVPAAARKDKKIAALLARKTDLKRTASRMRISLESGMCRGDVFTGTELWELIGNPIMRTMLEKLVFVGEGILGYPIDGGKGLIDHSGKIEPVKAAEKLRLAHPHDLLATGHWHQWQRDCFARERVQPFKQVFRELYVLTDGEKAGRTETRRYAGHQVQPRQALALLGARGWVTKPDEGVFRTFHEEGITAWLTFQEPFYTPAEVEGLTLEAVTFTKRDAADALGSKGRPNLEDVPPRLFSEVMRDLDLVVSVAHRGGVDPEASASTVEMRSTLLGETCNLFKLNNVRLEGNHAFVKGHLGQYTVHLGSAMVHIQPGGALFIVAIHSQHRGRIFLPFADDDPKTAEVISKVLLLARDREIKDPNLLQQIRNIT
jgi:hypothetical protein